jgi:hypothetical protein
MPLSLRQLLSASEAQEYWRERCASQMETGRPMALATQAHVELSDDVCGQMFHVLVFQFLPVHLANV